MSQDEYEMEEGRDRTSRVRRHEAKHCGYEREERAARALEARALGVGKEYAMLRDMADDRPALPEPALVGPRRLPKRTFRLPSARQPTPAAAPDTSTFGGRMQAAREAAGLSVKELARKLGMHPDSVMKWELGEAIPKTNRLPAILERLGIDAHWLLMGERADHDTSRVGQDR